MSTTIEDRLILLLREDGEPYGYWQRLEEQTGIAAARWRKAYTRQQRPTTDMLAAISKLKPHYAFWLATGITDAENGHTAPALALTFPEMPRQRLNDPWAETYFKLSVTLNDYLYYAAKVDVEDNDVRLKAAERTLMGAQWWGSEVVDVAYSVTQEDTYQQLLEAREQREKHRKDKMSPAKKPPKGAVTDKVPMEDPRTAHQGVRDLFWQPRTKK